MGRSKMKNEIRELARKVYETLGAGHEEAVYREAMSVELQDNGYVVKAEMPVSIKYRTSKGKEIIIGNAKADLYIEKKGEKAILELKAVSPIIKETKPKEKEEIKEYIQLRKYLSALGEEKGFLINFPFPPKEEPEIITTFE